GSSTPRAAAGCGGRPASPPAVFSAAAAPRTLRLSGELADGTILDSATTDGQLQAARELIDEGRATAGRADPHPLVLYRPAVPGDAPAVAEAVRSWATAGADTVGLMPTPEDPDPAGVVRLPARQRRPPPVAHAPAQ